MSVQNTYSYSTPVGVAGGLYDITDYVIDTRTVESDNGVMKLGMGVVCGSVPGTNIDVPSADSTADVFEGVTVNGFTQQHDLEGKIALYNGQSVGVLRRGRIWVRIAEGVTPSYGDPVYMSIAEDDAGLFYAAEQSAESEDDTTDATTTTIQIPGAVFITGKGTGDVAAIEIK